MSLPTSTTPRLASSFQRAGAMGFDLMLLSLPEALLMLTFGPESAISILGRFLIYAAYFAWFESSPWQATPGKRIFKIYVARQGGTKLTPAQALERFLVFMVFTFPAQLSMLSQDTAALLTVWIFLIWLMPILATQERTGVHDMVCRTRVWIGVKAEK
ncbi:MAG: RDD family protein [Alphaproteobacteria bacterium]